MHLFVSLNLVSFALVTFNFLILNFPPTKEAPVLTGCLILTPTGTNKPVLVIVFVVVVNALVVDEMVELLGELLTSDLLILLIPKQ